MNLLCLLPHLHGHSVSVDGVRYAIGPKGALTVDRAAHRAALLQNPAGFCLDPDGAAAPLVPPGDDGRPEYLAIAQKPAATAEKQAAEKGRTLPPGGVGIDFSGKPVTADDIVRAAAVVQAPSAPPPGNGPGVPPSATVPKRAYHKKAR